ncbi:ABC transporter ATP-binding protein [Bacillus capparidis]|uniref:Spermidine/putrescine transport system ATP-binding protein n=1 Tax=Bacillus capparidis TaxID=1840411 RepID=A0ABS4D1V3_9BACI|nr:ABC transporter ATP-binding protein [Bacillus capparidis]MBP1083611.1 putative spermidine/putrescine transport system ATP-binding protein [Bacillus capparidis]MED1094804.1 ABC transporter ATP-binding protein [Bacillus capparidis]
MSYLTIDKISLSFGNVNVLKNLSLSIEKGELVTLLGPSGCGKSSLLRTIAGLTAANKGNINIDERTITHLPPKDRQVGMVFQSYALFPNMTVYENVAFGLKMLKMSKELIQEKVTAILQLVGIQEKENAYPHELSGGQQQRAALARSVVVEPKILLLDEPLSALDAQIRKNLQTQLRLIQQKLGITMIFVTHDQEEAMAISDRIYLMNNGEIAQVGTPEELYTKPNSEFTARFIGNYNVLTRAQIDCIFNSKHEFTGETFAIRPEAFNAEPSKACFSINGKVQDITILGNIVRYELKVGGVSIMVEQLHHSNKRIMYNEEKTLFIEREDVISFQ